MAKMHNGKTGKRQRMVKEGTRDLRRIKREQVDGGAERKQNSLGRVKNMSLCVRERQRETFFFQK